jgi:hypothetical protein
MKSLALVAFICPAVFLMFGYNTTEAPAVVIDRPQLVVEEEKEPVIVQVKEQGFPFDVNGNFPYVVMVNNVVWTFKKEDVHDFLQKARSYPDGPGEGRTRSLSPRLTN